MTANPLLRNFEVTRDDIDLVVNILLEREKPMTTQEIALLLLEQRLESEREKLETQYQDATVYKPAHQYEAGTRLIFTEMSYATATVMDVRSGQNTDYGDFDVISVEFDDLKNGKKNREFAANLSIDHTLNDLAGDSPLAETEASTPEDLLKSDPYTIMRTVASTLNQNPTLERVAGYWFPKELVLEFDIGTLHLSEAVLDMNGGGPLTANDIIEQIGGVGEAPVELQVFSLNLALKNDDRFDEVGPTGQVLWYLSRMEPKAAHNCPEMLSYTPIEYDDDLLSDEMFDLETVLDDEWTDIEFEGELNRATSTLIYPHRRAGTLPLNAKNSAIFPQARTPRIHVSLIDSSDDEVFSGWVVHEYRYVYGLLDYYTKHHLPIGTRITVERGEEPGQYYLSHEAYKPRTEWIRILNPQDGRIQFENKKRAIGAAYDDLSIIGIDDLDGLDKLVNDYKRKAIATILRELIQALGKLSPQGTVHATTLYSAVNVMRRGAPGPIFATLTANPNFEEVGDHYWTLNE